MLKHSLMGIAVALLCSVQAWAADLTGKLAGINGAPDVQIRDGKLDNDRLTFWGVRRIANADVRFDYVGKVGADVIDFEILRADGTAAPLASHTTRAAASL